jgi:undecaprenyl-diphosphatase
MLEGLKNLDTELLLFFNHLNTPFLDFVFYWVSDKWIWIPFYIYLAWLVYKNDSAHFFIVLIFIAAAITISDQIASGFLKEYVMRLRPCHDPAISSQIHLVNEYCGGQYGFVSSHAANTFALTAFITRLFSGKKFQLRKVIWFWAAIVSFSRIYLGSHFPGDVVCGAALGIATGYFVAYFYFRFINRHHKSQNIS